MRSSFVNQWTLRTLCYAILLGLAALQMKIALQEQLEFSNTSGSAAVVDFVRSSYLLDYHAKRLHLVEGDLARAECLFVKALYYNPAYLPAWMGLAQLYNDQGKMDESRAILAYIDQIGAGVSRWRWDKALLAYQLGQMDMVARDISFVIEKIPGQSQQNALKMAFSLWEQPQDLLRNAGEQNVLPLFQHAIQTKKIETALALWPRVEALGVEANRKLVLSFLDSLIFQGQVPEAAAIWKKYFNPNALLYDGRFQEEPLNTAFGWRTSKVKGSGWQREHEKGKDSSSFHLYFSGTENLAFQHLSQIVPLTPARGYRLTASVKTKKLTTDQRPYIEIIGQACSMEPVKTEMMASDQDWTLVSLEFSPPGDCAAVVVQFRRNPSNHLDNLLAGDAWLRDLNLEETSGPQTVLEIRPLETYP